MWSPSPSSASGAKHPKQPIGTAQDALQELLLPEPGCHSQEQNQGHEREERGGRERTITRKRLLMHGQTGQQTKHAHGPPRKSPKKLQIRSSTDQQPATNCGVRQGICSERTMRLHGANGPNQTHWPLSVRAPQWRIHGAAAAAGGQRREKEAMRVERAREMRRPGGDCCSTLSGRQRRGGFGKKS